MADGRKLEIKPSNTGRGDYFKAEWLRPHVKAPDRSTLAVYGGSDFAVTANGLRPERLRHAAVNYAAIEQLRGTHIE
jgi:hypothetical protein